MKWFPFVFMFLATNIWAQNLELKTSEFLRKEVQSALRLLPSNYLSSVKQTISIEEAVLKGDENLSDNLCHIPEDVHFGLAKKNHIQISSKLVSLAQKSTTSFNCSHGSFKKLLTAVLIHELTHLKDNAEKISSDPDFQRIVGMKKVGRSSKKKLMSQNVATSPDAYEFKNLEESLAVNTEYLVLDAEFECRKPATANFLSQKLGIPLQGKCEKNTKILVQSAYLEDNYLLATNIDSSRVYQIHYLFAGKGKALMSRWGHAMFRLIVCAPFREKVGPDCMNDVSHHVVLSYRAYMSDLDLSYSKGLLGKYPSQLFIMRYLEVQQEYTKFDFRDLYSVPLKMTSTQKKDFLDLTLERYWTYQGKYYFLNNNCGTETQKHLAVALSEEQSEMVGSITPLKIYNDILKSKNDLSEGNLSQLSKEEMKARNYLVESIYDELNSNYQFLRPYFKSFQGKTFKNFLKKTTASSRSTDYQSFFSKADSFSNVDLRKQIVMKMVYLERYLSSRYLMDLPTKAFEKMKKDANLELKVKELSLDLQTMSVQPWEIAGASYGAPTMDEFEKGFETFRVSRNELVQESIESQFKKLQSILGERFFKAEREEIENLKENKILMNEFIKKISIY